MRPFSGDQFDIRFGGSTARVGQVAAVLRSFVVDGVALTESWADDVVPPMGCGIVLVPWPNRVRAGTWTLDGAVQQLDLTEPGRGNAIHGLLRNQPYVMTEHRESAVTLSAGVHPQHGYPFGLDTSVTYALSGTGLTVTHRISNVGSGTAPFGVGAHPYLRVGETPVDELVVTVPASTAVVVDDSLVPVGAEPVGPGNDLRAGVPVGSVELDGCFTDLARTDGLVQSTLVDAGGRGVMLWAGPDFGFTQVYNPPNFPDPAGKRRAIAIEPMTCGVDALNTGEGLRWLEPGESWSGSWGLRPIGF
ncbi:aldose epimerase [Nakamurella sp. YIM 132087]|uniref:Aldose epimerase n=1 Tax=Nakamurella alba TaxID=2665158 RepID=A0A7K1FS54_9ACTN|nr:aldose epimerase [Nakamurella alba]